MNTATAATPGFASLAELQQKHAALVKTVGRDILANLKQIEQFVRQSIATGTVLDAPTDREAAQSLIIFWTARLKSALRDPVRDDSPDQVLEVEDTLLAEFSSAALVAAVIVPADEWLNRQSPTDQTLARRLVLRLVGLREDGSFDVLPSASGICEDLAPQDQARRVLAELVRLGVVRRTRSPSGHEEITLRSAELIKRWPRLQEWMAERKRFRQKAKEWALRRAEKAADPTKQSFMRRAEEAFQVTVHKVGAWIEAHWRALLVFFKLRGITEDFLTQGEYEEAETYRDKNAVEFRLIYQKRQLDKERAERRQVRAFAFAVAAIAFAALSSVAIWGWIEASKAREEERKAKERESEARKQEENAKMDATLKIASWQVERGDQLETDDRDSSGAFLYYAAAWSNFDASADVLPSEKRERLCSSYLRRLGIAREQLPLLSGMAYHKNSGELGGASARTPDGRLLVTVGADKDGQMTPPAVQLWRWTESQGHATWEESLLPWGQPPPDQAFADVKAYLSPNGQFAAVSGAPKNADGAVYMWEIPKDGPGRFIGGPGALKGYQGKLIDAGFSPDGGFFAAVTRLDNKGKVSLWRSNHWGEPIKLAVPEGIGALGKLAFCPTASNNRLAVAVEPVSTTANKRSVICLEWLLKAPLDEAIPRHYEGQIPLVSAPGEFVTFVTYNAAGSVLLVSPSLQKGPRAEVSLFETKEDPTTQGPTKFEPLWPPPAGPILHAAFSPSNDQLLTASADGTAVLWALYPGQKRYAYIRTLRHKAQIFKADFSPNGQYIVTASRDRRALVWHADSGQLAYPSLHHSGSVTDAGFTDDGRYVITSSRDTIHRWDVTRGASWSIPLGTMRGVRTTSADPEGRLVVTAGDRVIRSEQLESAGWARMWDAVTGDPRSPELQHPTPVRQAAISGSGGMLVSTVTSDGELRLWEASSGRQVWSEKPKERTIVYTAFGSAEGGVYLLALMRSDPLNLSCDSYLRIYLLNSKGEQTDWSRTFSYKGPFTGAIFGPKCKRVIAYTGDGAGDRGVAVVWEVQSKTETVLKGSGKKGTAHDDAITHVAFTPHGDHLVTTGRDDKAFVWDLLRDGIYQELQAQEDIGHTGDIEYASLDQAGTRVVTAGADGLAIVWQRASDEQKCRIVSKLKNGRALTHAIFSTDERYVVTADQAGTVRLWDANDGRPLATNYHPGQLLRLGCREGKGGHPCVYLLGNQSRSRSAYSMRLGLRPDFSGADPLVGPAWPVVTEWHLTLAPPPTDNDRLIAKWTAGRQLIYQGDRMELSSLAQDSIFNEWKEDSAHADLIRPWSASEEARWHEREAALYELVGQWEAALNHWNLALKGGYAGTRQPVLLAHRARVHGERGEWEEAEEDLSKALDGLSPGSDLWWESELLRARADARQRQRPSKLEEAISDYLHAVKANPHDGLTHAHLAVAYVKTGNLRRAVEEYDEAVRRDEQNPDLLLQRAVALMKLEDRHVTRAYTDYLAAGRLFKARQRYDDAEKAYYGAVGLFKHGVESSDQVKAKVHAELAELQVSRAVSGGDEKQREKYYHKASQHFLEATNLDKEVWTYWSGLARCLGSLNDWKQACDAFDQAIKRMPNDAPLARDRAEALIRRENWDEAAKAYRTIIELEPKIPVHRLRMAAIYLQPIPPNKKASPERLEEARRCLAEAVKDFPREAIIWRRLAVAQLAARKIEEYQATCAGMFEALEVSTAQVANIAAWVAALGKARPRPPNGLSSCSRKRRLPPLHRTRTI
jgi:WD40 repeat protein/tetratricopeptide (TPR) repeat protein